MYSIVDSTSDIYIARLAIQRLPILDIVGQLFVRNVGKCRPFYSIIIDNYQDRDVPWYDSLSLW